MKSRLVAPRNAFRPKGRPTERKGGNCEFSILVATRNRAAILPTLIRSLARQAFGPSRFEVRIIDNASRDDTAGVVKDLKREFPQMRLHYHFLPVANASLARNEGARLASGKNLVFLDDDCEVSPQWLARAASSLRRPGVRALGGPALVPHRKIYPAWFRGDWEDLKHPLPKGWLKPSQYLFEGNFFIRRSDYLALGGMRPEMGPSGRRFAYHEGTELQNRIRQQNLQQPCIFYHTQLAVSHRIDPAKVLLRNRWRRMLQAGLDHPRAHSGTEREIQLWKLPFLTIRAFWRGVRVAGSCLFAVSLGEPNWRRYAYNQTAREVYRLGETLGNIQLALGYRPKGATLLPFETTLRSRLRRPLLRLWRRWSGRSGEGQLPLGAELFTPVFLGRNKGSGKILWSQTGETNRLVSSRGEALRHPLLLQEGDFQQPSIWLAELPKAAVYGPSVAVVSRDRRMLADVSIEWSKEPEDHGLMRKFLLPRPKPLGGTSVLLASTGGNTFHHWMMDVLPRLGILEEIQIKAPDHYLINSAREAFQRESLEILGISAAKWVGLGERTAFQCETLLLPSLPCASGHPTRRACEFLRKKFLPASRVRPGKTGRKILLGRADTQSRQVEKWESIRRALLAEGFEEILPSRMSLREQALVFHGADWVVGIHGAALTNLVFCRPGTKVVELFGWNYVNPCYRDLCSVAGLEHHGVVGRGPGEGPEIVFELHDASGEIHVEPGEVLGVLKEAGLR